MFYLSVFLLTLVASAQAMTSEHVNLDSTGVASTAHPLATQAAEDVYRLGGNSVDAAIAASLVLSVVEPTMSGLGGRAIALIRSKSGNFYGYNGMTEIPQSFVKADNMPAFGYSTVATPGLVAMLGKIHQQHGKLPFSQLVNPAIKHAKDGFVVLPGEAARQKSAINEINQNRGMTESFLQDEGSTLKAGQILKQPVLAKTLTAIAQEGSDTFYTGKIARLMSEDMARNGGYVTLQD
ncbi:MAG: hypothetical protein HOI09_03335, partial [Porticoccaceae bacterium]|nr:hypothetical protein [Porticoccaceae bacterium]